MDEKVTEKIENEVSINENSETAVRTNDFNNAQINDNLTTTESINDLSNAPIKKLCPNCGALLEENELFCHACGKNINMQTQPKNKKINLKILIPVVVFVALITVVGIVSSVHFVQKKKADSVLVNACNEINKPEYIKLSDDMKSLKLDTNPHDIDEDDLPASVLLDTMTIYKDLNEILGLPASLSDRMGHTASKDGFLTETYDNIRVSWKYHPDYGLEAVYELVE